MVTFTTAIVAGRAYWMGYYGVAFWVVCHAIINGGLAAVWVFVNPDWYWQRR
jgi:hypothetical protein